MPRQVKTKRGERWVEDIDPTQTLWDLYKSDKRPEYLSASKWQDKWQMTVWGKTSNEVHTNLQELAVLIEHPPRETPEQQPDDQDAATGENGHDEPAEDGGHKPLDEASIPF